MHRKLVATVFLLAAISGCAPPASRPAPQGAGNAASPARHENLQVLPDTISRQALIGVMRNFTASLGVRCTHCHVSYEGAPDSMNWASDARPAKDVARGMMRMVREINGDLLPAIRGLGDQPAQVGCMTCHRGAPRPLMLEDTLLTVVRSQGADSAVAAYGALRARYYGRSTYDFGERSLSTLAERLVEDGRPADARRILELNAVQFPGSAGIAVELGGVLEDLGERDAAIAQYRRALTIQPGNRQAEERLRELGVQP